ncbi:MAG: hypothetical protein M1828_004004 [Chrysothrix sp. TS-e1954]|nr:MAG: hypothetical protein M1828_004004 [Chrysothrix sp. TS-e1954]
MAQINLRPGSNLTVKLERVLPWTSSSDKANIKETKPLKAAQKVNLLGSKRARKERRKANNCSHDEQLTNEQSSSQTDQAHHDDSFIFTETSRDKVNSDGHPSHRHRLQKVVKGSLTGLQDLFSGSRTTQVKSDTNVGTDRPSYVVLAVPRTKLSWTAASPSTEESLASPVLPQTGLFNVAELAEGPTSPRSGSSSNGSDSGYDSKHEGHGTSESPVSAVFGAEIRDDIFEDDNSSTESLIRKIVTETRRSQPLEQENARLKTALASLSQKSRNHDYYDSQLRKKAKTLRSLERSIQEGHKAIDTLQDTFFDADAARRDLRRRETSFHGRKQAVAERAKGVDELYDIVKARELSLVDREEHVMQREIATQVREAAQQQHELDLQRREAKINHGPSKEDWTVAIRTRSVDLPRLESEVPSDLTELQRKYEALLKEKATKGPALLAKIRMKSREIQTLRSEPVRARLENAKATIRQGQEILDNHIHANAAMVAEVRNLQQLLFAANGRQEIAELEAQNRTLQSQLRRAQKPSYSDPDLLEEARRLHSENAKLQADVVELQSLSEQKEQELRIRRERMQSLEDSKQALESQLQFHPAKNARTASSSEQHDFEHTVPRQQFEETLRHYNELRHENVSLDVNFKHLHASSTAQHVSALTEHVRSSEVSVTNLAQENEQLRATIDSLQHAYATLQQEANTAQSQYSQQIGELNTSVDRLQNACISHEQRNASLNAAVADGGNRLSQQTQQLNINQRTILSIETQLKAAKRRVDSLVQERSSLQYERDAALRDKADATKSNADLVQVLTVERPRLNNEKPHSRATAKCFNQKIIDNLKEELENLQESCQELRGERDQAYRFAARRGWDIDEALYRGIDEDDPKWQGQQSGSDYYDDPSSAISCSTAYYERHQPTLIQPVGGWPHKVSSGAAGALENDASPIDESANVYHAESYPMVESQVSDQELYAQGFQGNLPPRGFSSLHELKSQRPAVYETPKHYV